MIIFGICGDTEQAVGEAGLAREHGYDAGLLNLSEPGQASDRQLLDHRREAAAVLPLVGFYLQPSIG